MVGKKLVVALGQPGSVSNLVMVLLTCPEALTAKGKEAPVIAVAMIQPHGGMSTIILVT